MQHVRLMPPTLLRRYSIGGGPRKRVTASPYVQDGCLFQWKKSRIVEAATRSPLSRAHGEIAGVANHPPRFFFPIPPLLLLACASVAIKASKRQPVTYCQTTFLLAATYLFLSLISLLFLDRILENYYVYFFLI